MNLACRESAFLKLSALSLHYLCIACVRLAIGVARSVAERSGAMKRQRNHAKRGLLQGRQPPEVNYVYGDAQVARATI